MKVSMLLLVVSCVVAAQSAQAQNQPSLASLQSACAQDAQKLCAGVQPGGGRIVACLKQHKDALSDQCKRAAGLPLSPAANSAPSSSALPSAAANPSAPAAEPASSSSAGRSAAEPSHSAQLSAATAKDTSPGSFLRMKQVQVIAKVVDPALGQGTVSLPAMDLLIPSTWDLQSSVQINSAEGCFADIFAVAWQATSPNKSLLFERAPNDSWQYADDPAELRKLTDPNRRARGAGGKPCPVSKPIRAEDYFRQKLLPMFPKDTTVVSIEPYPALNAIARQQLGLPSDGVGNGTRTEASRARIAFQKDGKAMEEWVAVVILVKAFRQGRGTFYDCHAIDILALLTPKGKLDENDRLFKVMISSMRPEPKWQAYSNNFIGKLYQMEAQKEAAIDAIWANFQNQVAQSIMSVTANAQRGSEQSFLAADQNIRGVQTFRDPTTGSTMELSNLYDHAWLNGSNEYIMSDDPNYNPNGQLNGSWNQLQAVRP